MLLSIILLILSINLSTADKDANKVAFLTSFVKSQHKPTTLIVWQDCFDVKHKIQLIKNSFTFTMFSKQDSLNESDFKINPQHCLFVVDLTCTETPERIIEKVNRISVVLIIAFWYFLCYTDWRFTLFTSISMADVFQWRRNIRQHSSIAW